MVTPVNPPPLDRTSPPRRTAPALPEGVRVRVLHAVYGDARAAEELMALLTDRQAAGLDPLPVEPAEQAPALLRSLRGEIRSLPDGTRLLLLLAAADQFPVATHAFLRAVAAVRLDTRPLEAAEAAGIAHAGAGGVVFRDAWTRIASYETGSPADRRDVHRLLARVLHGAGETPRRSWHRAAGAVGPSGRLAAELRAAAGQARAAGQLVLARALLERAAALCPDPLEQSRLRTRAATHAWNAGEADRARRLAAGAPSDDALTGLFALHAGNATEAFDTLLTAAVREGARGGSVARGSACGCCVAEEGACGCSVGREGACGCLGGEGTGGFAVGEAGARGSSVARGSACGCSVTGEGACECSVARGSVHDTPSAHEPPAARKSILESTVREAALGSRAAATDGVSAAHLLARVTEAAVYTGDLSRCREAAVVAGRLGIAVSGTLTGLAATFEGRYEDARKLLEAAAGRCGPGGDPTDPTLLVHAGIAALLLGDDTRAAAFTVRAATAARARGATATVAQALEFRAYADFWTGRPHAGAATAKDALRQAHATGHDNGACHLRAALAMFAAVTGDEDACRERAAAARSYALARGLGLPAALAQWSLAFLDLASGRYAGAAARLRALAGFGPGHGHRAVRHLATPHYVEAAVRTGDTRVARAAHADYHRWASAVRSPDELALSARCRALLAPGAEAVEHYRTALDLHARGARDFERARTELLFGGALRRLRHRTEARDRLHSALEAFDCFGAPHCAAQARAELRALGAPAVPARSGDDPTARLTAQQLLIARMAADGATNREIAARLALSPRTIDHHLRGVFARLGIRARIELVRLLGDGDGDGDPVR
ncbi:LuxR C-terminal-related transcriptional regulator [Streptomyces sp. NPDC048419]|uniref:LuxR C-terminal-related transcriptional regulator n=1 Tax=Streptomyces sp. NPDC048419 TaxID=3365547 RepID=UPI00371407A9